MPALLLADPPLHTSLVEAPQPMLITRYWNEWLQSLVKRIQKAPYVDASASLTGQTASIGITPIIPRAISGVYRVSWWFRVTLPGGISSSLTFTVGYTEGGVNCTVSGAAAAGNVVTTVQSGSVLVRCDPFSVITYATTYASAGAPAMQYRLDVIVEAVL